MSFISEELERQMTAINTNPSQLALKTKKISASQLYKWVKSEQTSIDEEQITLLAKALSHDICDHAQLIKSHLLDERFGPGSELVRIEVDTPEQLKERPRPRSKREKAIAFLTEESITNRDTYDLLVQLARVHGAEL